ncbi:heterokaryon incompatibility protein-domain-containing protein [Phaeosphaeriaceae sp. PMI808]|nr:heterokaryon incompatibility protein-domain-containing protein [Phaeosphaeriaceae sp. PMI808]
MAHNIYEYRPLQHGANTRVLFLQPASEHSAPLCASLQQVQIIKALDGGTRVSYITDNAPAHSSATSVPSQLQYEAISYTWGRQGPTENLEIDGEGIIKIRSNVDTMLRYLRSTTEQRCIWVDALCINQEDQEEKGVQVRSMGEIYAQAKSVVIWVALPTDSFDTVGRFFQNLVKYTDSRYGEQHAATWEGLRSFMLDRPWFTRRWVIQEVIMAKQATMLCGKHSIDFMVFIKQAWLFAQRHSNLRSATSSKLRKHWMIYKLRSANISSGLSDVLSLMVEFATAECEVPHDRIYALNALTSVQAPISYEDPLEKVYTHYAEMHINSGNLAILNCGGAFRSSDSIPSWVPDWRHLPGYMPLATQIATQKQNDHLLKQLVAPAIHDIAGKSALSINGLKLGTVTRVGMGAEVPVWDGNLLELLQDWYTLFDRNTPRLHRRLGGNRVEESQFIPTLSLGTVTKREMTLSPDHPWLHDSHAEETPGISAILAHVIREAQEMSTSDPWTNKNHKNHTDLYKKAASISDGLKVLLKDLTYSSSNLQLDLRYDTNSVWGSESKPLEGPNVRNLDGHEFSEILCRTVAGRACFWGSDGSFGIGPADMEPGDLIIAIPTCPTPYIFHPRSSKSPAAWLRSFNGPPEATANHKRCSLVGDCYIHNFEPEESFVRESELRPFLIT